MRSIKLYYVYDNVGETTIAGPIPAANDLVAALGFRDSYIKNKKLPYDWKALDLVRFANVSITEDGEFFLESSDVDPSVDVIKRFSGKEIMDFIKEECLKLEIDDEFVETEEKNE